VRFWMLSTY
ncbi:hypothetical protein CFC21_089530, partial [Triticum aestivum]